MSFAVHTDPMSRGRLARGMKAEIGAAIVGDVDAPRPVRT